jgi:dual specificity MAP kinase phosphatase
MIKFISSNQLHNELSNSLIIDLRSFISYHEKHIKNSINATIPQCLIKRRGLTPCLLSNSIKPGDKIKLEVITQNVVFIQSKENITSKIYSDIINHYQQKGREVYFFCDLINFEKQYPNQIIKTTKFIKIIASPQQTPDKLDEIVPGLFLGSEIDSNNINSLTKHNIRYILNVAEEACNRIMDRNITYKKLDLIDTSEQIITNDILNETFDFIDNSLKEGNVLVHCVAGISRSPTIIIAYLMRKNKWTFMKSYHQVALQRSKISPQFNFIGTLMNYEKTLTRRSSITNRTWSGTEKRSSEITRTSSDYDRFYVE